MRSSAIIAAHQATDAAAALLLFEEEDHFGDLDVVEKLTESLVRAIHLRAAEVETCDESYLAALGKLRTAAEAFIEGWAG